MANHRRMIGVILQPVERVLLSGVKCPSGVNTPKTRYNASTAPPSRRNRDGSLLQDHRSPGHPHVSGESSSCFSRVGFNPGSSPREWGKLGWVHED